MRHQKQQTRKKKRSQKHQRTSTTYSCSEGANSLGIYSHVLSDNSIFQISLLFHSSRKTKQKRFKTIIMTNFREWHLYATKRKKNETAFHLWEKRCIKRSLLPRKEKWQKPREEWDGENLEPMSSRNSIIVSALHIMGSCIFISNAAYLHTEKKLGEDRRSNRRKETRPSGMKEIHNDDSISEGSTRMLCTNLSIALWPMYKTVTVLPIRNFFICGYTIWLFKLMGYVVRSHT